MACFKPIRAYKQASGSVVFVERGDIVASLDLPCGRCIGCRLERSRQWAVRCVHEAQLHDASCFVTLTYRDDGLPPFSSLRYRDVQLFLKRLRFARSRKLRFFCAGEYGSITFRPHYHLCLFGVSFPDGVVCGRSSDGSDLFSSSELDALWRLGSCTFGALTFASAAYCARYIVDKLTGDMAAAYDVLDESTGEIVRREPPFCRMSLKPGIGAGWYKRFRSDVYPHGSVVVDGVEQKPPRYYDRKWAADEPLLSEDLALRREREARARYSDSTDERLAVREQVVLAKAGLLKRTME